MRTGSEQSYCPRALINVKGGGRGTIPVVLSGANRGRQGAQAQWGPHLTVQSGSQHRLAVIPTAGLMVCDVAYVCDVFALCVRLCSQLGMWELFFCVYPVIENLSSIALSC